MDENRNCQHEERCSISDVNHLRACRKLFTLDRLELNGVKDKRYTFMYIALDRLKKILKKGESKDNQLKEMQSFLYDNYSPDWFLSNAAYEKAYTIDSRKILRMMEFILDKDAHVVGIDIYFSLNTNLDIRGVEIENIKDKADLVLSKGEQNEAIKFIIEKPGSSYAARKDANKVDNNLFLVCMATGLCELYPNLAVSTYHLNNKDDKSDYYPAFENKRGNSVISTRFAQFLESGKDNERYLSKVRLGEHLLSVSKIHNDADCKFCIERSVCKFNPVVRYPIPCEVVATFSEKKEYTNMQLRAIRHVDGPMNVVAVPGAGKTGSLVARLKYLIQDCKISPKSILCLVFSNKACDEIRERTMGFLGDDEEALPNIFTLNGFGYRLLRDNPSEVGKVKLAGKVERLEILLDILGYEAVVNGYQTLRLMERHMEEIENFGFERFKENNKKVDHDYIFKVFTEFRRRFDDAGFINYDDQINMVNQMFKENPGLLKMYSRLYKYIMVDEFQDINEAQANLIYSLAHGHGNIVVFGDDDQAIYRFRGGSNQYMIDFPNVFQGAETVYMEDNFRSNDKILMSSERLIQNNKDRYIKKFIPHKEATKSPLYIRQGNKETLLNYLKEALKVYDPGDITIIARKNDTLIALGEFLLNYVKVNSPKDYIINDTAFQIYLDLLTLLLDGFNNDNAFYRLAMVAGVSELMHKKDKGKSLYQNLVNNGLLLPIDLHNTVSCRNYNLIQKNPDSGTPLSRFGLKLMISFKLFLYSQSESALGEILSIWTGIDQKHPMTKILCDAMDEKRMDDISDLYSYMKKLVLFEDTERVGYEASKDAVNLMTAHDSKGREFPFVIIYGTEEFKGKNVEEIEDERRLLFVAMTRAKNNLILFGVDCSLEDQFSKEIFDTVQIV